MKKTKTRLPLNAETIRPLVDGELDQIKGAGMCSTQAPTGMCPTSYTTKTK